MMQATRVTLCSLVHFNGVSAHGQDLLTAKCDSASPRRKVPSSSIGLSHGHQFGFQKGAPATSKWFQGVIQVQLLS